MFFGGHSTYTYCKTDCQIPAATLPKKYSLQYSYLRQALSPRKARLFAAGYRAAVQIAAEAGFEVRIQNLWL